MRKYELIQVLTYPKNKEKLKAVIKERGLKTITEAVSYAVFSMYGVPLMHEIKEIEKTTIDNQ